MSKPAIEVKNISKRYRIGGPVKKEETFAGQVLHTLLGPIKNLRNLRRLNRFKEDDQTTFWALQDINFEVQQGEVLGIIGHNGAGKSTLLKLLSRITEPTTGEIILRGRVNSLLEVGTGFHPDLSGRDNIYMNGTILGMTKREIDRKLEEIIDFSGVAKYIDTPVKRYSSGMTVRLAFSVAAHLEPEILIVDEVLAVGDAEFQKKCLGKMQEVSGQGRTVLFVSHNMSAVQNLCKDLIILNKGTIDYRGNVEKGIKYYFSKALKERVGGIKKHSGSKYSIIASKVLVNNSESQSISTGDKVEFYFTIKKITQVENIPLSLSLTIYQNGNLITNLWTDYFENLYPSKDYSTIVCIIPKWLFRAGSFVVNLYSHSLSEPQDSYEEMFILESTEKNIFSDNGVLNAHSKGYLFANHSWTIKHEAIQPS